jgi:PAS domain-containing protein
MAGRVFEANPAFLRLFGLNHLETLLHNPIFIFSTLPPDVAQSLEYGFETASHQCSVFGAGGRTLTLNIEFRLNYQALDGVGVLEGIVRRFNNSETDPKTGLLANLDALTQRELMNREMAVQR